VPVSKLLSETVEKRRSVQIRVSRRKKPFIITRPLWGGDVLSGGKGGKRETPVNVFCRTLQNLSM